MMPERYAVYYAPEQGSDLECFGDAWLGRNALGQAVDQPDFPGLDRAEIQALTATPKHYGFHGTLVPPMELGNGITRCDFLDRVEALAQEQAPFEMAPLAMRQIGSFLVLAPLDQVRLKKLAEAALRALRPYREPPSAAEKNARRAKGLTANQERLLEAWGYPYVLEEFRFHITLTGQVKDEARRSELFEIFAPHLAGVTGHQLPVRELCLFHQQDRTAPFTLIHRALLGARKERM